MSNNKAYENFYRRQAKRLNLLLEKSRARIWSVDNHQGWRISDIKSNTIIAGHKWDLTIEEAATVLNDIFEMAKSTKI